MSQSVTRASKRAGASISRALQALLDEARAAGCANPKLFFEAESAAVFVMDGDHPHEDNAHANALERQQAIVLEAPIRVTFDTGAW